MHRPHSQPDRKRGRTKRREYGIEMTRQRVIATKFNIETSRYQSVMTSVHSEQPLYYILYNKLHTLFTLIMLYFRLNKNTGSE